MPKDLKAQAIENAMAWLEVARAAEKRKPRSIKKRSSRGPRSVDDSDAGKVYEQVCKSGDKGLTRSEIDLMGLKGLRLWTLYNEGKISKSAEMFRVGTRSVRKFYKAGTRHDEITVTPETAERRRRQKLERSRSWRDRNSSRNAGADKKPKKSRRVRAGDRSRVRGA